MHIFFLSLHRLFLTPSPAFDPLPCLNFLFGLLIVSSLVLWCPYSHESAEPSEADPWDALFDSPVFGLVFREGGAYVLIFLTMLLAGVAAAQNHVPLFLEPFFTAPAVGMPPQRMIELTSKGMCSPFIVECGARCIVSATEASGAVRDEFLAIGAVGVLCHGLCRHETDREVVKACSLALTSLAHGSFEACKQVVTEV